MTTFCRRWFRVRAPGAGQGCSALRQLVVAGAGTLLVLLAGCAANTCPLAAGVGLACEGNLWHVEGIPNLGRVRENVYRSGQPVGADQWRTIARLGVTDVLKLNALDEGVDDPAPKLGITVHHIPIPPSTKRWLSVFEQPSPEALRAIIEDVLEMRSEIVGPEWKGIGRINADGTVTKCAIDGEWSNRMRCPSKVWLIHCVNGHDRTGLAVMLVRVLVDGWTPLQAYAEALQWGYHPQLWLDRTRHEFSERNR